MPDAKTGDRIAARQCWECFKRRLVCDRTLPSCKKCTKTGKKCPGYNEQKPLQWVEPGTVTLRRKKKESRPTTSTISTRKSGRTAPAVSSGPDAAPEVIRETSPLELLGQGRCLSFQWPVVEELQLSPEAIELSKSQLANLLVQEDKPAWWRKLEIEKHVDPVELIAAEAGAGCGVGERIMCIGNKDQIKEVVERGQHWEAALLLQSNQRPLAKIQRLLEVMEMNRLPSYDFLSDETHDVVQAVNYFNTRIYPDIQETDCLAPNPAVVHFPVWALHILAPPMHYTTVCLSLNYHLTSSSLGKDRATVADNRLKIYHYRGLAIRALNENVARKETRSSDQTIASILMFMAMEVHSSTDVDWRLHADGMKRLIDMRGGFEPLRHAVPHLTSALVIFVLIVTFSNSLGPASRQISITEPLEQHIEEVEKLYSLILPYTLCPSTLFIEIIRINRLRKQLSRSSIVEPHQYTQYAQSILSRTESFVPREWAQSKDQVDGWQLIGSIWQSAIVLYCIMSLQAFDVLPSTTEIDTMRMRHRDRLFKDLKAATRLKQLKKISTFPLCVLGVEAGYHVQQSTQIWIERHLEEHARLLGSNSPLKAREVLRRYWRRKKPGWNECFDEPSTTLVPAGVC